MKHYALPRWLFALSIFLLFMCPHAEADNSDVKSSLEEARFRIMMGQFEEAKKTLAPLLFKDLNETERRQFKNLSEIIVEGKKAALEKSAAAVKREKSILRLDHARRLLNGDDFDGASKEIDKILDETSDITVLDRAESLRKEVENDQSWATSIKSWAGTTAKVIFDWAGKIAAALICFFVLFKLITTCRAWFQQHTEKRSWMLDEFIDESGRSARAYVLSAFKKWSTQRSSAFAGLLKVDPQAVLSSPAIQATEEPDLAPVWEALPSFGGVEPGPVIKAVTTVQKWFTVRPPWIHGVAKIEAQILTVRLTCQRQDGSIEVVSADRDANLPTAAKEASEDAAFQMYFVIANDATADEAQAAKLLETGSSMLHGYLSNTAPEKLEEACKLFTAARDLNPDLEEAQLYEGMALDLLERHDDAIRCFHFLINHTEKDTIRLKAQYNEAIAYFRKYRPQALEKSIGLFDGIVGKNPVATDLVASPVRALAYAAKANALAHRPIWWHLPDARPPRESVAEIAHLKKSKIDQVIGWRKSVREIIGVLDEVLGKIKAKALSATKKAGGGDHWDRLAIRQLQWAVANAKGNLDLNCANEFFRHPLPDAPDCEKFDGAEPERYVASKTQPGELPENLRRALFESAEREFQNCESLFTPGVETLTNLATTLLGQGRYDEARTYAKRAIQLNPRYEYAYFRLAECFQQEKNTEQVKAVLRSFTLRPTMWEFIQLFHDYYIEPRTD
jgi:tetratricopeptide (TPR) repeat protein